MICSNCGKEINEGATYCLECGAPVDEPVVITDVKTKKVEDSSFEGIKKGPFFDYSGYVKSLGKNVATMIALFGAILVYLSSFFSWMWIEQGGEKTSLNLFEMGGKNLDMALDEKILIVMAVLIILSSIDMFAFSASKFIEPLKSFEKNYFVRALPIFLTIAFFLVILENKDYSNFIESIKLQMESNTNTNTLYSVSGGRGFGPIMLIVGQVLYGVSIFLDYKKREANG